MSDKAREERSESGWGGGGDGARGFRRCKRPVMRRKARNGDNPVCTGPQAALAAAALWWPLRRWRWRRTMAGVGAGAVAVQKPT